MRFDQLHTIMDGVSSKGNVVHLLIGVSDKNGEGCFLHSATGCG